MAHPVIELLQKGKEASRADTFRHGNLIRLPAEGSLVISGDLHGHRRNFERICTHSNLADNPDRHLVLQEIIHGGPQDDQGGCLSYRVLFEAIRLKIAFPDQVHIIMGNHDTAFLTGSEVMKDGREMNRAMLRAIKNEFSDAWQDIDQTLKDYMLSQPLAVKTHNKLWMSHSLPSDRLADKFDLEILSRPIQVSDCQKPGPVYVLTWGRRMSQDLLDKLARALDVELFILGHQPQSEGWSRAGENLLILASEHNHGCLVHVQLDQVYTLDKLVNSTIPLSSIM